MSGSPSRSAPPPGQAPLVAPNAAALLRRNAAEYGDRTAIKFGDRLWTHGDYYAESVRFRFLIIPIIATVTMLVCFWSVEILLIVYALLLPFYTLTGKLTPPREASTVEQ